MKATAMTVFALVVGLQATTSRAETVTLDAARDTTLYESTDGSVSNGAGTFCFAGRTNRGELRRALVAFDVAGSVPAGSTITSVELSLQMSKSIAGPVEVALHRVTEAWGEGGSVGDAGGGGQGGPSQTGDATWIHTFFPDQQWTTAGGVFDPTPSATTDVAGVGAYTWGSSNDMVADVQGWLDDPSANHGWEILAEADGGTTAKRFNTRESSAATTRPRLTIGFTPPTGSPPVASFTVDPASPFAGQTVMFSDTSTGQPTSWSWTFGDGTGSTDQNPSHVYAAAGTYVVTLTAANTDGSSMSSVDLEVFAQGVELTDLVLVPAAASAPGAAGSFFRTLLEVNNPTAENVEFELWWLPRDTDNSDPLRSTRSTLAPGETSRLGDVVLEAFGLDNAAGAIVVAADHPGLAVASRTFTAAAEGTYGQSFAGIPASDLFDDQRRVRILLMTENSAFRSNLGLANGGDTPITLQYERFDRAGTSLGSGSVDLAPYGTTQLNRVFANVSPIEGGYVDVWTDSAGAAWTCYGSVLDNQTSDPTTVAPQ